MDRQFADGDVPRQSSSAQEEFFRLGYLSARSVPCAFNLKKYHLPVIIAENGICTTDDNERWEYIQSHLRNVHLAMEQGVDVKGYLYWSLMDNFEWAYGFAPRFGLIDIDYSTSKGLSEKAPKNSPKFVRQVYCKRLICSFCSWNRFFNAKNSYAGSVVKQLALNFSGSSKLEQV